MFKQSHHTRLMIEAAEKASIQLKRDFAEIERLQVSEKAPNDFVTSADLKSEEIILEHLHNASSDFGYLTEEHGVLGNKNWEYRFIIDPIDGTSNFMHGLPFFCISIALEKKTSEGSEIIAGMVHAPILHETYMAEKGEGAMSLLHTIHGTYHKLEVSKRANVRGAMVSSYLRNRSEEMEEANIKALAKIPAGVRIYGSAALELAYVAAGKLDGFWCKNLKSWDIAAGILLCARGQRRGH